MAGVNLSTGIPTSFIDFAKMILKKVGIFDIPLVTQKSKPEGVFARYGDTKIKKTGFPINNIREGIEKSINFLRNNHK